MTSVFTKIIKRELPARIIWENDEIIAFLTIAPLSPGHTLVVPKLEVDHWQTLDPSLLAKLAKTAQLIGKAIKIAFNPERIGLQIAGFEVSHVHLHVFGANSLTDFNFANTQTNLSNAELDTHAETLTAALNTLI